MIPLLVTLWTLVVVWHVVSTVLLLMEEKR